MRISSKSESLVLRCDKTFVNWDSAFEWAGALSITITALRIWFERIWSTIRDKYNSKSSDFREPRRVSNIRRRVRLMAPMQWRFGPLVLGRRIYKGSFSYFRPSVVSSTMNVKICFVFKYRLKTISQQLHVLFSVYFSLVLIFIIVHTINFHSSLFDWVAKSINLLCYALWSYIHIEVNY